jgi:hypothetical protein
MREKTWVTAVTTGRDWGERTTYLRTDKSTRAVEYERGVSIVTDDEILMYVSQERLISIEFDTEDPDHATEG